MDDYNNRRGLSKCLFKINKKKHKLFSTCPYQLELRREKERDRREEERRMTTSAFQKTPPQTHTSVVLGHMFGHSSGRNPQWCKGFLFV